MAKSTIEINIKINMSMWDALKFRISGLHKGITDIEQIGVYSKINYKALEGESLL